MIYTAENVLVREDKSDKDPGLILSVTPEGAGWEFISFQARRLDEGGTWSFDTGENEFAFVNLSGLYSVKSSKGSWAGIGGRANVFAGGAHALYLPRRTSLTVTAEEAGEFAVTWAPTTEDHEPWLIQPEDVAVSIRGGDNVSRQINDLLPPGSPVHRIVLVEVYTPSGNWSSYPPHKHDVHIEDEAGELVEADLEEVYFYHIDRPEGFAYQRVYTDENSPMHAAGSPIDALVRVGHNEAVLVPEGLPPCGQHAWLYYVLSECPGGQRAKSGQPGGSRLWVGEGEVLRSG